MSLLKAISKNYPLATSAFVQWITARETLTPYLPYIKVPIDKLPIEMAYGVLLLFFRDQGVGLSSRLTQYGRTRTRIFVRRATGVYREEYTCSWKETGEPAMKLAIAAAFRIAERKLSNAIPKAPDSEDQRLIGLDVDAIMLEAERIRQQG